MRSAIELFPGVYSLKIEGDKLLFTKNLTPGLSFYGEPIYQIDGIEYRSWNPTRSKLAAGLMKGLKKLPFKVGSNVLYLGIASGTTASHLSDIIGSEGHIWGVEFSVKPLQNLIDKVTVHRRNISPIFGDARRPNDYSFLVPMVDVIYADVAQPNQAQIVAQNAEVFLVKEGWAILAIKARSIDVRKSPLEVYEREVEVLKQSGFTIEELVHLGPFEKDHAIAVAKFHAF